MYGEWVSPGNDYAQTNKKFDLTNGLKCELHAQDIPSWKKITKN